MSRWRGRPAWETDIAAREARTPAEATERARRGRARVNAALAGETVPDPTEERSEPSRPAGYELVACVGCYRPVWGLPGSRCDHCPPTTGDTP